MSVSVRLEGFDALEKEFKAAGPRGKNLILGAMFKTGNEIANQARAELKKKKRTPARTAWFRGHLGRSYTANITSEGVEIGSALGYAAAIENGRRPGKFPPVSELLQWVKQRLSGLGRSWGKASEKSKNMDDVEGTAYAVARHIAENGTEAHPHLGIAFDLKKGNVEKHAREAFAKL